MNRYASRRFQPEQEFAIDWCRFRVEHGKKGPDDLVILWWDPYGECWSPVLCDVLFLLTDFICENEDFLYREERQKGGEYLMLALKRARTEGWRKASLVLREQRDRKAARREDRLDGTEQDYWDGKAAHHEGRNR